MHDFVVSSSDHPDDFAVDAFRSMLADVCRHATLGPRNAVVR